MKEIRIHGIYHSPGYGDMRGEYHEAKLIKDKDGNWTYVRRDREDHRAPTVTAVYKADEKEAERLFEFISETNLLSLENRPESNLFVTDYSPWSWSIVYEQAPFGKARLYCTIREYRRYSERDYGLLNALSEKFAALCGEEISRTAEENDR